MAQRVQKRRGRCRASRRGEGEPGADEAVQGPEQGDEAEDPGANGVQGQGMVQAEDEGRQVAGALAEVAPYSPSHPGVMDRDTKVQTRKRKWLILRLPTLDDIRALP